MMKKHLSALFILLLPTAVIVPVNAQTTDSLKVNRIISNNLKPSHILYQLPRQDASFLKPKSLVIPGAMILYGFTTLSNKCLQNLNKEFSDEVYAESPHNKIYADNYLQFAPAITVYALNVAGVKGVHNLWDRSMLFLMSNVFLNSMVYPVKKISHQLRPDGSKYNSFPSGHTAEAFANAEFMRQEYKDVSPWYGVAGYAMAATTGYLRMYNNKHWFSDVVAGAGIGIVSTKLAYWLYPKIQHKLFKDKPAHTFVMPSYSNKAAGISFVHQF